MIGDFKIKISIYHTSDLIPSEESFLMRQAHCTLCTKL